MRWFWKISETVVVVGLLILIAIPSGPEAIYATVMFAAHPVLFTLWAALAVAFVIAVGIHALQARRKRKKQTEAVPYRGTL